MSVRHDRQFLDLFTLVVGGLVGIAVGIYFLAASFGRTQARQVETDTEYQRALEERIAPVAKVAIAGRDNSALDVMVETAAVTAPPAVLDGQQVYDQACHTCHGAGIAGAPKYGDKGAWAPRLAQGAAILHKHAIEGFQGKVGMMPPKGGRLDFADQSIVNGVDYMVNAVK